MFANVVKKVRSPKKDKKTDMKFYEEHIEEFKFFVKYYPVFQSIATAVGDKELAKLDAEKPCQFRQRTDIPFRCKCDIKVDGSDIKTIKDCKNCKVSKME